MAASSGRRPDPPPSISNVDSGVGCRNVKSLSQDVVSEDVSWCCEVFAISKGVAWMDGG